MPEQTLEGATVVGATSFDSSHPPKHIVDGEESTFWSTTGLFPQEFVIKLRSAAKIESIRIESTSIKELVIEASEGAGVKFTKVMDVELARNNNRLQVETMNPPKLIASLFKFKIMSGHSDFATVQKVVLMGIAFSDGPHPRKFSTVDEDPKGKIKRNNSF